MTAATAAPRQNGAHPHRIKTTLPEEFQSVQAEPTMLDQFLGWFSIGLGMAELLAPKDIARATGVKSTLLLQAYGLREIATGVGIFTQRPPTPWLWARVAGDALDLATLSTVITGRNSRDRGKALLAAGAVAGVMALDIIAARKQSQLSRES